jgi:hypothetical protein
MPADPTDPLDHANWREICAAAAERVAATGAAVPPLLLRPGSCAVPSADDLRTLVGVLHGACARYYNLPLSAALLAAYANSTGVAGTLRASHPPGTQFPDDPGPTYSTDRAVAGLAGILPGLPLPVVPLPGTPLRHPLMRGLLAALRSLLEAMAYLAVTPSSDERRPLGYGWARANGEYAETHESHCDGEEAQYVLSGDWGHDPMGQTRPRPTKFGSVSALAQSIAGMSAGGGCTFPYGWSRAGDRSFVTLDFYAVSHWGYTYTVTLLAPPAYKRTAEPLPYWGWNDYYGYLHEQVGYWDDLSHTFRPGWGEVAGYLDVASASRGASVTPVFPSELYVLAGKSGPTHASSGWVPDAAPQWDDANGRVSWPAFGGARFPSESCERHVFDDFGYGLRVGWNLAATGSGRIEWPSAPPAPSAPAGHADRKYADEQIYFGEAAYRQWTSRSQGFISVYLESDTNVIVECKIYAMVLRPIFQHLPTTAPSL